MSQPGIESVTYSSPKRTLYLLSYRGWWNLKAIFKYCRKINQINLKGWCVCTGGRDGPLVQIFDHQSYTVYSVRTSGQFQKNETGAFRKRIKRQCQVNNILKKLKCANRTRIPSSCMLFVGTRLPTDSSSISHSRVSFCLRILVR